MDPNRTQVIAVFRFYDVIIFWSVNYTNVRKKLEYIFFLFLISPSFQKVQMIACNKKCTRGYHNGTDGHALHVSAVEAILTHMAHLSVQRKGRRVTIVRN